MAPTAHGAQASVEDVIITSELSRRPARVPDHAAESRALVTLAQTMTESPQRVFQKLVDFALELCRAGSAGISVWDPAEPNLFRWRATAGAYAGYVGGTMPRDFSPCGTVLDRNTCLLMAEPVRAFPYIAELSTPVREVLLVPFYQADAPVGTIWVVAHDDTDHFDAEDERIVTSLTKFAEAAIFTLNRIEAAEHAERARQVGEQNYQALVKATSDVVYRMSADWSELQSLDGRELIATTAMPARGWMEKNVPPLERARVREAIERAIATKGVFELEHKMIRPDGSVGWVFSRAIPIQDADGTVVEWLGTASDVTRRKEAEKELRDADRKKDDFLATLAHELRNPLAPISSGVSLLHDSKDEALMGKTLGVMRRQVDHMVRLIDDLLDVSRITQGKLELRRERVSLSSITDAALEDNQLNLERARHTLRTALCDEVLALDADHTRIAQVIGNLLNNACKYTPDGGEIELSTRREGDDVVIAVRDSGQGIPPERIDSVFDMFSQLNRALDRARGGLGIGLALVRRLVEMHGGSVSAFSEGLGRGSTFTVRLPLATGAAAERQSAATAVVSPALGATVWVVDDNADAAELLALSLENAGYQPLVAHDAQGAIALSHTVMPAVIILDIGLPGMSGYELAEHLRGKPGFAQTVFIALTGWGTDADRRRALAAGFDMHLTKPVSGSDLQAALGRAASLRASSGAGSAPSA